MGTQLENLGGCAGTLRWGWLVNLGFFLFCCCFMALL